MADHLDIQVLKDIQNGLRPSTQKQYKAHWKEFSLFAKSRGRQVLPASSYTVLLYVALMHQQGKQVSTIRCRLAAIADRHKLANLFDPTVSYAVGRMLKGYSKQGTHKLREPIGKLMLGLLLKYYDIYSYDNILYKALFSVMYAASLRIGEVAYSGVADHIILFENCKLNDEGNIVLHLHSFKHSKKYVDILLHKNNTDLICPVHNLRCYLAIRGIGHGPLFVNSKGLRLSRQTVAVELDRMLSKAGFDETVYNTHSLRIGKATDMFLEGASDEYIKQSGRWNTDAWKAYLKPAFIST